MANAKLFLDRRGVKDDASPTMLRIMLRHKDTTASIPLDIRLSKNQWDGEHVVNHPQEKNLNICINKKMADVESAILKLSLDPEASWKNANELKEAVLDITTPGRKTEKEELKSLFLPYYEQFVQARLSKGTKTIYDRALKWIKKYDPEITHKPFRELDRKWLIGLDQAMSESNKKNTRSILLRSVRAVFSQAQADGIISTDPFKGFDLKEEPTVKRSMDLKTLQLIRDMDVEPWQEEYRDMFMLMFYLIGINAGDLFLAKKEQLVGDRLNYIRKKTGKQYSIKVQPEAMKIIEKYKGDNWLLCPMDRYSNYKDYLQHMNRALGKLGLHYTTSSKVTGKAVFPGLSTYWSRHTWATLAYEIEIPVDTIGQALGHSDRQHIITFVYIRLDDKKVDAANRAVLDYVATGKRQKISA